MQNSKFHLFWKKFSAVSWWMVLVNSSMASYASDNESPHTIVTFLLFLNSSSINLCRKARSSSEPPSLSSLSSSSSSSYSLKIKQFRSRWPSSWHQPTAFHWLGWLVFFAFACCRRSTFLTGTVLWELSYRAVTTYANLLVQFLYFQSYPHLIRLTVSLSLRLCLAMEKLIP